MTATLLAMQVRALSGRSIARAFRQPAMLFPSIVFPLVMLAVNTGGLGSAVGIPSFPADSFLDFAIAVPFMQGALFTSMNAGQSLADDIQRGFLSRLSLTPMSRAALIIGHVSGAMAIGLVSAACYLAAGLAAGVQIEAGVAGAVVLVALSALAMAGFAALGSYFALRAGSAEAVQSMFPLMFVAFFLSSMNMPRDLIEVDWFRTVATWNPVSYLIEGMRSVVITGWDAEALARGFATAAALVVVGLAAASRALTHRMERT